MTDKFVLLVEDNADDEELALFAFKQAKLLNDVVVVRDGEEALDFLFGRSSCAVGEARMPQVILLDLKLPKLGGLEVLDRLRANPRTTRIPVVVLTSSDEEDDVAASYRLGANSYVRKPVGFQALLNAVQKVGLYWLLLNETAAAEFNTH
jgi:two-component system response regulator